MIKKHFTRIAATFTLALAIASAALVTDYTHKGEGDIPIIRVIGIGSRTATVTVRDSDGSEFTAYSDSAGSVYLPQLAHGTAAFNINTPDCDEQNFSLPMGFEQRYVLNASPVMPDREATVTGLTIKLPGYKGSIAVGEQQPIVIEISGTRVQGLKPTIWLEGGIASLDGSNRMQPVLMGSGRIHAELMGVAATFEFTVE
ncbi:MAG: hypothetical protein U0R49_07165 [Fimbriimonadales bacterium]